MGGVYHPPPHAAIGAPTKRLFVSQLPLTHAVAARAQIMHTPTQRQPATTQEIFVSNPVIIEAAINGATTKATNPNVPITAEEIAADALAVIDAGAAIVHAHCDPVSGPDDEVAERYLEAHHSGH